MSRVIRSGTEWIRRPCGRLLVELSGNSFPIALVNCTVYDFISLSLHATRSLKVLIEKLNECQVLLCHNLAHSRNCVEECSR